LPSSTEKWHCHETQQEVQQEEEEEEEWEARRDAKQFQDLYSEAPCPFDKARIQWTMFLQCTH
jgi:hypothetical protein